MISWIARARVLGRAVIRWSGGPVAVLTATVATSTLYGQLTDVVLAAVVADVPLPVTVADVVLSVLVADVPLPVVLLEVSP